MSPDVFSPQARKWGLHVSLQERLFYDYESRQIGSQPDANVIFLTENYRSNEDLLQFSSDMFYGGGLSSGSSQTASSAAWASRLLCCSGERGDRREPRLLSQFGRG